ncbi:hypothetical protein, partial [Nocardia sp. NPDC005366]|uniref:hypothetical protein n=1 Tax=Nocardia sp. NPDC005366 TaxID=3156878 RepID=UPI0033B117D5
RARLVATSRAGVVQSARWSYKAALSVVSSAVNKVTSACMLILLSHRGENHSPSPHSAILETLTGAISE